MVLFTEAGQNVCVLKENSEGFVNLGSLWDDEVNLDSEEGIIPEEVYTLIYEIVGRSNSVSIQFTGEELLSYAPAIYRSGEDFDDLRRKQNLFVTLWATYRIDKKEFTKLFRKYNRDFRREFKKAIKTVNSPNNGLRSDLAVYFYIKLTGQPDDEKGKQVLRLTDCRLTEKMINELKDTWQQQRITKRLNIKSFEEFKSLIVDGVLTTKWQDDTEEFKKAA